MVIHNITISGFSHSRANIRFRYWFSLSFALFMLAEFALVQLVS